MKGEVVHRGALAGEVSFQPLLEWELKDGRRHHHCKPVLRFIPAFAGVGVESGGTSRGNLWSLAFHSSFDWSES